MNNAKPGDSKPFTFEGWQDDEWIAYRIGYHLPVYGIEHAGGGMINIKFSNQKWNTYLKPSDLVLFYEPGHMDKVRAKDAALIARAPEMAERIEELKSALAGLITCLDNGIKPDIENIRSLLIESK